MTTAKFWLASNSPRRREIISWLGWTFQSAPANIDESALPGEKPLAHVNRLALGKCCVEIAEAQPGEIVIAADTIVALDDDILGKPADEQDAIAMLKSLRNRSHQVITAIAVRRIGQPQVLQDTCISNVHMRAYSDAEIEAYVRSGDSMDKAGSYAIQNEDFHPALNFAGCFASVMGMPLCHLERTLRKLEGFPPENLAVICQGNLEYDCPITARVLAGENIG
ncbi:MAG: nucleoside triphosphate pyrophosphatase [Chloroflexota bacterium]|nr:nucleoside triphosphate pyrophosphatase [Chloroflexota bacterium]